MDLDYGLLAEETHENYKCHINKYHNAGGAPTGNPNPICRPPKCPNEIIGNVKALTNRSINVELCWVPGHAGIQANELADVEAKKAALIAKSWSDNQDNSPVTIKEAQREMSKELSKVWQRQWDNQTEGRFTHSILPNVKLNRFKFLLGSTGKTLRIADVRLNRIIVGHTLLRTHYLQQALDRRAGINVTTQCDCGDGPQDLEHFFLECSQFTQERNEMSGCIMEAILKNRDCKINSLSVALLIGDNENIPRDIQVAIRQAVLKFLSATASNINI